MRFHPWGRYLVVKARSVEEKEIERGFVLPEDFEPVKKSNDYQEVEVVSAGCDIPPQLMQPGTILIVEAPALRTVRVGDEPNLIVALPNVVGILLPE